MNYRKINLWCGWLIFAISATVYLLTIPHTTSFWDCGEFIAAADKLEVGHPPGNALFLLIARMFILFAPSAADVATMVNAMSAIVSAFTIMFLFWTITHLAKKLVDADGEQTSGRIFAIMGAGTVGALAYTFSDTFWFSAVEAEVYSMSSLFTAVVFWAILKWESVFDQPFAIRWIVLIAYLMGLSIGVHLLNLLAIPAIVFVYYFKKYEPTKKGVILALFTSLLILVFLMYGVIPYSVIIASWFELMFVNSFGLPFNSGLLFFVALLFGGLGFGIYRTFKNGRVVLNTILLCITMILFGYSTTALTVIRSNAEPPMNENQPDQMFSLLSYINREQYGDRPLFFGQTYSAPAIDITPKTSYGQKDGKYYQFDNGMSVKYDAQFNMFMPRMFSSLQSHIEEYKKWVNIKGTPIQINYGREPETRIKPTFGENIKFLFNYQLGFMYFRYFMWNFAGRQNDIQGHGEASHGNWISGIPVIDNSRIGDQTLLPESWKNEANNKYYFLPLILGIIGLGYQYIKNRKDFLVVMLLFVLTGIAIVIYLNQTPLQPRERDYAYAGSFYAFTIWIGLAVLAVHNALKKLLNSKVSAVAATTVCMATPVLMGAQNWDDHDRSGRYMARDFAYNYVNSCAENAMLITKGDNDTFPIWYIQDVEGVRTDVRVLCTPYLNTDWYVRNLTRRVWDSPPMKLSFGEDKYALGKRDVLYVIERKELFLNEKYEASKDELEQSYNQYYDNVMSMLKQSKFPVSEAATWQSLTEGKESVKPSQLIGLTRMVIQEGAMQKYDIDTNLGKQIERETNQFFDKIGSAPLPLKLAVKFATDDSRNTQLQDGTSYVPSKKFVIPVDKEKVLASGTVHPKDTALIVDKIVFTISANQIGKGDLVIMDILANNEWERPLYTTGIGDDTFASLEDYFQNEGFVYRFVPIKNDSHYEAWINSDVLYENLVEKCIYRGINDPDVHHDWTNIRTLHILQLRQKYTDLAEKLISEGENEKAQKALKKIFESLPLMRLPIDYFTKNVFQTYYASGDYASADNIIQLAAVNTIEELNFTLQNDPIIINGYEREEQMAIFTMQELLKQLERFNRSELRNKITAELKAVLVSKTPIIAEVDQLSGSQKNLLKAMTSLDQSNLNLWLNQLTEEQRHELADVEKYIYSNDEFAAKVLQVYTMCLL